MSYSKVQKDVLVYNNLTFSEKTSQHSCKSQCCFIASPKNYPIPYRITVGIVIIITWIFLKIR